MRTLITVSLLNGERFRKSAIAGGESRGLHSGGGVGIRRETLPNTGVLRALIIVSR